jgi:hypothetical protein
MDDIARCYGHGCAQKENCRRFLTLPLDDKYDDEHGYRVRSYQSSFHAKGFTSECEFVIYDH